jgi:hypothetical protein
MVTKRKDFLMAAKKAQAKKMNKTDNVNPEEAQNEAEVILLTSKQEVADFLRMSVRKCNGLLRKYPFIRSGVSGKVNKRWHVDSEYVQRWIGYVHKEESRHPDARRMRPAEPPGVFEIQGR